MVTKLQMFFAYWRS